MHTPTEDASVTEIALKVPPHVVYRAFPGETVALNLNTGSYYGLNAVAGEMLELISERGSAGEVAGIISERYGIPIETATGDVQTLVRELLSRGLLESSPAG